MALITRVYLVDDLDGSQDDVSTISFNLDGTDYEIDLTSANAERMRGKMSKFVDAASPAKQERRRSGRKSGKVELARTSRDQTHAVRDWARSNGYGVSARGRIAKSIQKAFDAAH